MTTIADLNKLAEEQLAKERRNLEKLGVLKTGGQKGGGDGSFLMDGRHKASAKKLVGGELAFEIVADVGMASLACGNYPTEGELQTKEGKAKFEAMFGKDTPKKSWETCQKEALAVWEVWNCSKEGTARPCSTYAYWAMESLKYGLGEAAAARLNKIYFKKIGSRIGPRLMQRFGYEVVEEGSMKAKSLAKYTFQRTSKYVGKGIGKSAARGVSRVGAKLAAKAALGAIGWILMIFDIISMGIDMSDPMGLAEVLSPKDIREMREGILKGSQAQYKQMGYEFPMEVPTDYPKKYPGTFNWVDQKLLEEKEELELDYIKEKTGGCIKVNPLDGTCMIDPNTPDDAGGGDAGGGDGGGGNAGGGDGGGGNEFDDFPSDADYAKQIGQLPSGLKDFELNMDDIEFESKFRQAMELLHYEEKKYETQEIAKLANPDIPDLIKTLGLDNLQDKKFEGTPELKDDDIKTQADLELEKKKKFFFIGAAAVTVVMMMMLIMLAFV